MDGHREIREMLAAIGDAHALRANPLAEHFFAGEDDAAGLQHLHRWLRRVLSPEPRLLEIFEACDLGKTPHKQMAAALHLSLRQFYRLRAALIDRIARFRPTRAAAAVQATVRDSELQGVYDLLADGYIAPAIARIESLRAGAAASAALDALEAQALAVGGESLGARARLTAAAPSADSRDRAFTAYAAAVLEFDERPDAAGLRRLSALAADRSQPILPRMRSTAFSRIAEYFHAHGAAQDMIDAYQTALDALPAAEPSLRSQRIGMQLVLASAQLGSIEYCERAIHNLYSARECIEASRLETQRAWCELYLAYAHKTRLDLRTALTYADRAVGSAGAALAPRARALILASAARIIALEDIPRAFAVQRSAEKLSPNDDTLAFRRLELMCQSGAAQEDRLHRRKRSGGCFGHAHADGTLHLALARGSRGTARSVAARNAIDRLRLGAPVHELYDALTLSIQSDVAGTALRREQREMQRMLALLPSMTSL